MSVAELDVEAFDNPGLVTLDEPRLWNIDEADYHADPIEGGSLSSTTARKMLLPSCPALARWEQQHHVFKGVYDLGSAAHKLILGAGSQLVEVEHDSWRTKDAQAQQAAARLHGHVPLLSKDMRAAEAMATAVLTHPLAGALLAPGTFVPERSVFWRDTRIGVARRAMFDAVLLDDGIAADVKTTTDVSPAAIAKTVASYGYHQQGPFYLDGLDAIGLDGFRFLFVFVAKEPPHLVTVAQLDDEALALGYARNRRAIDLWAWCLERDLWPGYSDDIETIALPRWADA